MRTGKWPIYSWFTYLKWLFSIAMFVYQRVMDYNTVEPCITIYSLSNIGFHGVSLGLMGHSWCLGFAWDLMGKSSKCWCHGICQKRGYKKYPFPRSFQTLPNIKHGLVTETTKICDHGMGVFNMNGGWDHIIVRHLYNVGPPQL